MDIKNTNTLDENLSHLPLSPIDGRYKNITSPLVEYLSEAALNRNRLHIEIEWLIYLTDKTILPGLTKLDTEQKLKLRALVTNFDQISINELAEFEKNTAHDVKAIEYYLKKHLDSIGIAHIKELVHFGCTSEDINNLAYALGIKESMSTIWLPAAKNLVHLIASFAQETKYIPMLARTHGQAATPTTVGKELAVAAYRLLRQIKNIESREYLGKFNGATGTYAAHTIAAPDIDWEQVSKQFVNNLSLDWNPLTTQIESHDWQSELFSDVARFNRILHNFCTDMWTYISLNYFQQSLEKNSVGSSTMPHKINPIRFENAEANLEISAALLDTISSTLVTSRLQRDLTDSSTQRNIGVALAHSLVAINNVIRGIGSVGVNEDVLGLDLDNNWEVLGEAIQTVMRAEIIAGNCVATDPYEKLKEFTQGKKVTQQHMSDFLDSLGLSDNATMSLKKLSPADYVGVAASLVRYVDL